MRGLSAVRRLAVLSPHLDDAAISLGATIARLTAAGTEVNVVTVFGGDPDVEGPAGEWDRRCGFATAPQATAARRAEERAACRILGARAVQLPFADEQYAARHDEAAIWTAVRAALAGVEAVLLPGFPLIQEDHRWVTFTALDQLGEALRLGFYVDQPYAVWESIGSRGTAGRLLGRLGQLVRSSGARARQLPRLERAVTERCGEATWETLPADLRARWRKLRALRAYRSQLRGFGRDFIPQIMLYEWADGGEPVGWTPAPVHIIDPQQGKAPTP